MNNELTASAGNLSNYLIPPQRIWVFGKFAESTQGENKPPQLVTSESICDVLASYSIQLSLTIPQLLPGSDSVSKITLHINELDDFTPGKIAQYIEPLNGLLRCQQIIQQRLNDEISTTTMRELLSPYLQEVLTSQFVQEVLALQESDKSSPASETIISADDQAVDNLLDMLDLKDTLVSKPDSAIPVSYKTSLQNIKNNVDRSLFAQLNKIYHHTSFQALEKSWRSLEFLLNHVKSSQQVEVSIINTDFAKLVEDYHQVISNTPDEQLPTLCLVDFAFNCTPLDSQTLEDIALLSDAFQVQALSNVSNNFLGKHYASEVVSSGSLATLLAQTPYVKWNSLRAKDSARWLALSYNRFLLREPYTRHNNNITYNEWVAGPDDLLFANGGWLVAAFVVKSFNAVGWATAIKASDKTTLQGLPQYTYDLSDSQQVNIPLEAYIPETLASELSSNGIIALQCALQNGQCFINFDPLLYKLPRYNNELVNLANQARNNMSFQLLSSRLSLLLTINKQQFLSASDFKTMADRVEQFVSALFAQTGQECAVNVEIAKDSHQQLLMDLRLKMDVNILHGIEVQLAIPL